MEKINTWKAVSELRQEATRLEALANEIASLKSYNEVLFSYIVLLALDNKSSIIAKLPKGMNSLNFREIGKAMDKVVVCSVPTEKGLRIHLAQDVEQAHKPVSTWNELKKLSPEIFKQDLDNQ